MNMISCMIGSPTNYMAEWKLGSGKTKNKNKNKQQVAVCQLIFFGKGSCNLSGGSHKVGLPGWLTAAAALCKAKGVGWGWGVVGQTDKGLTFEGLKMFDL